MAKAAPIITSFNAGEWSPLMAGRTDVKYHASACRKSLNFIPTPQGPSFFRSGTRFVAEVKNSSHRCWLWRFEFNVEQAYTLEFGDHYMRFYANHGVVLSAPTVPLEVVTPWSIADLTASDGTFNLRSVQSGDVIYFVHPNYPVQKLSRLGAASFTLVPAIFTWGPFKDTDPANTVTVYASSATGTVTLTASAAIFLDAYVGTPFYLEGQKANSVKQWESGKAVAAGALRRSDGKTYYTAAGGTTGNTKPTHAVGSLYDGDTGVLWEYQDPGYGWGTITAVAGDHLSCTLVVGAHLPYGAVSNTQPSTRWAFAAWNPIDGFPTVVTFFRERLTFFRGQDGWTSVAGDYEVFSRKDDGGQVVADMSVVFTISSDKANKVMWAAPSDIALIIGTAGDEHAFAETNTGEAFGPANRQARKQSEFGSKHVPAIRVGEGLLYAQKSGRKVRDCTLAEMVNERWVSSDTTVMAEHITQSGVLSMAYQQEPHSIVWAAMFNGKLAGFTLNRQQDVRGWHPHQLGGTNALVESLTVIPDPDGSRDEVWFLVNRTIGGVTRRYIEYMERDFDEAVTPQGQAFHLDCGLTYQGVPTLTLTGLDHLEGETVAVVVDGASHPNRVVSSGSISLQGPISDLPSITVHVGLAYIGILSPMPVDAGGADGTSQGKIQRVTKCGIRFLSTGAAKYGRTESDQLDSIELRGGSDPMDTASPLFTGDKVVSWPDGYEGAANITIVQDMPQPCTVVALMPHVVTADSPGSKNR